MTSPRSGWLRPVAALIGVVVVFFTVPGRTAWSDSAFILSVLAMVAGTVVLAWAITSHVRRQLRGDSDDLQSLVMLLALVLMVFAFGFYTLERSDPGQVVGLSTRIDAFYFTLATMATVGYGDVHAAGQVARALTAAQMIFNIIFVGALAAVLTGRVRIRAQERERARQASPTAGDVPTRGVVPPSAANASRTSAGGAMGTVDSLPVDETTEQLLAGLAHGEPTALGASSGRDDPRQRDGLDPRTRALVRIASLVAVDAPGASYSLPVASAVEDGATAVDFLDVIRAVAPEVGGPRVAAGASHVMTALGLVAPNRPQARPPTTTAEPRT
jgi:voltage-gated potassium channel